MRTYIWLSRPLDPAGPHPPAIPDPKLGILYTVRDDGVSVHTLQVASHTGTHLDAPAHVVDGGLTIHAWKPEELVFTSPVVIDLRLRDREVVMPEHLMPHALLLSGADIALFRFGYGSVRLDDPPRFSEECPGFGIESAAYIRETFPRLRAVGMDVPSLACIAELDTTMKSHNVLLKGEGRKFLVIEEMVLPAAGESSVGLDGLVEVRVNPWLVEGMDSGPATVVGVIEE